MPLTGKLPVLTAAETERAGNAAALLRMITSHWVSQTVRAGAELRVTDHISAGARTAPEVARLESGDPDAVFRLMRAMAAIGLLGHDGEGGFSVTALGNLLREDAPGSLRAAALARSGSPLWESLGLLPQAVRAGKSQIVQATGGDVFDYFAAHEEAGQTFSLAMADLTRQVAVDTVALLTLDEAAVVVDIGGASGALVLALMGAHPRVTGQVFDLPHVIGGARAAAEASGLGDRFSAMAGDFFESVPKADYYLLKWVLHDWPDQDCVRILRNCRAAGGPGARMLVVEALIGDVGQPDLVALFDMNMLAATEGRQRNLAQFDEIFGASGWRRTAVARTRGMDSLLDLEAVLTASANTGVRPGWRRPCLW